MIFCKSKKSQLYTTNYRGLYFDFSELRRIESSFDGNISKQLVHRQNLKT